MSDLLGKVYPEAVRVGEPYTHTATAEFPPPDFLGTPTSFIEAEVIERGLRIDHEYRRLCGYAVEVGGKDLLDVAMRPILHTLQAWLTEQHRIARGLDPKTGERTSERRRQDDRAARAAGREESETSET